MSKQAGTFNRSGNNGTAEERSRGGKARFAKAVAA